MERDREEMNQEQEALLAAQSRIAELESQQEQERQAAQTAQEQALLEYAVTSAVAESRARDPELVTLLLHREELSLEDGAVRAAVERLRRDRPYLFADGGLRPAFAAPVQGRALDHEDETVARRYQNNPWYRRR